MPSGVAIHAVYPAVANGAPPNVVAVTISSDVAILACFTFRSWSTIAFTKPSSVKSMMDEIAVGIAPATCGLNAIFNWVISVEQSLTSSLQS